MSRSVFVFAVIFFQTMGLAQVHGAEFDRSRLSHSFEFAGRLMDRQLVSVTRIASYEGDDAFKRRDTRNAAARGGGTIQYSGVVNSNRDVLQLQSLEPFPSTPESILVKILMAHGRESNINYAGPTTQTPIDSFSEGPLKPVMFDEHVASLGGVWLGYLLAPELPHISQLLNDVEWSDGPDGGVVGTYKKRRIEFAFQEGDRTRLSRVTISPAVEGPQWDENDYFFHTRVIELSDWTEGAETKYPRQLMYWELRLRRGKPSVTTTMHSTMESVGPPIKVSDRYGDYYTDVPDGTHVQVNDYMGIDFIWENGQIVRKVDRVALADLVGQPFFASPFRRLLLMGLSVCLIAAVAWFIWRRSSPGPSPRSR